MLADLTISPAVPADAPAIAAIYAHHVLHGTATFEIAVPDQAEIAARLTRVLDAGWPWLVARAGGATDDAAAGGELLGYAYAGQMAPRAAYRYTCETSIYLRHDRLGLGIGTALLAALLRACEVRGFRQAIALIVGTEPGSAALHRKAGFVEVGRVTSAGRKQGKWLDVITMQRPLGAGDAAPPEEEP